MQSTASRVLQTSILITGGDSSLGDLTVLETKPDPQTALSLFSTQQTHPENNPAKTGPLDTLQ